MTTATILHSLDEALAAALMAHREFDADETLAGVSFGRYNRSATTLEGTYYFHLSAERHRRFSNEQARNGAGRTPNRANEITAIVTAYNEAAARIAGQEAATE